MGRISDLFKACFYGDEELLKRSLQNGANVNGTFKGGKPLRYAVQEGHLRIIKMLVKNGADIHEVDPDGFTLLDVAVGQGHKNVVKYLLKLGADVNQETNNGTALHTAGAYGRIEIAKLLIEAGADIKRKTRKGQTSRYFAKRYGHSELVKIIDELRKRH